VGQAVCWGLSCLFFSAAAIARGIFNAQTPLRELAYKDTPYARRRFPCEGARPPVPPTQRRAPVGARPAGDKTQSHNAVQLFTIPESSIIRRNPINSCLPCFFGRPSNVRGNDEIVAPVIN